MGYILGLDLGIASVGYGIIDSDSYEIIKYGVRLNEEANAEDNLKRRTMRGGRRLKSRRRNRINAIKNYLNDIGLINKNDIKPIVDIYDVRVRGLNNKLTPNELACAILNIAKHRGSSLEVAVDDDSEDAISASALQKNTTYIRKNNLYVCEHQLSKTRLGKIRDFENVYKMEDYEKELRKILSNQNLSNEIIEKIVLLVTRRRDFSEGPGSEKYPTKYGSYREIIDENGNKVIKKVNLIEETRGKCSIFKNEPRIAKNTYTAYIFNLLNDLNNVKYYSDGEKKCLTTEQKKEIISIINKTGKFSVNDLCKYLGIEKSDIEGLRIDSKEEKILTTFDVYSKFIKQKISRDIIDNHELFDNIIEVLTRTQVVDKRKEEIIKIYSSIIEDDLNTIANMTKVNGYHSLSKKAMDILINEMLVTNDNQMQIIQKNGLNISDGNFKGKDIPFDNDSILSPVARRVHRQAIIVLNELRKEFGEFESIVIETTRDKNSKEQKKNIVKHQKERVERKEKLDELLLQKDFNPSKLNSLTRLKVLLYEEQNGKTIYAGLPIDLNVLINDPTAYQIEHIIPYAISFDNSMNNKALASAKENQLKGKMTPFQYFKSGKAFGNINSYDAFKKVVENANYSKEKKNNLLNESNVTKFENMEEFANRNLIDTSYGIRSIMNVIKKYFKDNEIATNVFTIKGKVTHSFRVRAGIDDNDENNKIRDNYIHHAVDALIIAASAKNKVFNNAFKMQSIGEDVYLEETGEFIDLDNNPFDDGQLIKFIKDLKKIDDSVFHFSYKIDTKTNRQISDETIYSTRNYDGVEYVIKKYKDIYGKEGESLKKLFDDGKADCLLSYRNDIETYKLLKEIYDFYKESKNPFAEYKKDHGYIKKYSKNNNGPIIKQLKYKSEILGNHLSVSQNYEKNKDLSKTKNVVLLQTTPYRTDVYRSPNGLYKFLTIRRYDVKYENGMNIIDENRYNSLKENKKILPEDIFLFSLNRNNIISIVKKDEICDIKQLDEINNYYRFIGTNNDKKNIIEVKYINKVTEKQLMLSIGKSIVKFEKYNVSPAGKYQKVVKEDLKLKW